MSVSHLSVNFVICQIMSFMSFYDIKFFHLIKCNFMSYLVI
jgi:hypothetical protein